jgi:hypothetical protein
MEASCRGRGAQRGARGTRHELGSEVQGVHGARHGQGPRHEARGAGRAGRKAGSVRGVTARGVGVHSVRWIWREARGGFVLSVLTNTLRVSLSINYRVYLAPCTKCLCVPLKKTFIYRYPATV